MGVQPTTEPAHDHCQLIVAELAVRQVNHALRIAHKVRFIRFYRDRQNGIGAWESEPDGRVRGCEARNSFVLGGVFPAPFTATHARQPLPNRSKSTLRRIRNSQQINRHRTALQYLQYDESCTRFMFAPSQANGTRKTRRHLACNDGVTTTTLYRGQPFAFNSWPNRAIRIQQHESLP